MGFSQEIEKTSVYLSKGIQYIGSQKDSAYFYLQKTIVQAEKANQIGYILNAYRYLIYANGVYFDLRSFKINLDKLEEVMTCNPRFDDYSHKKYYQYKLLIAKGNYQYKLGNYEKAEQYFTQMHQHIKSIPEKERKPYQIKRIQSALSFLAAIYRKKEKYSVAKEYYYRLIDFLGTHQNQIANWESSMALGHVYLAKLFQAQKEYKKSREHIQKAQNFYISNPVPKYTNATISSHHVLVKNYLLQNQPDKALTVLKKIEKQAWIDPENLKFSIDQIKYKARAYTQKEDFETALHLYRKSLKTTQVYYQTKHHPNISRTYAKMGEVYAKLQQFDKSIFFFQKALSALSKDFESTHFSDNPKPKKVLSKLALVEVLREKQKSLAKAHTLKNNLAYLKAANQTAKDIISTLDALKPEFESKVDMQFLLEETYPAFYQMMETAFLLHEKTSEKQYLQDAFYFSEKSKAVLLLSAVQKTGATKFAGVPDSILTREKQYRATINHLEKKHFKNPNEGALAEKLFDIKNEFYVFLSKIGEKYPKYHRLKYKTKVANIAEIQDLLRPKEAVLDYYLTDDFLYYFVIGPQKSRLMRIPFSKNDTQQILRLQKKLSRPGILKIEELQTLAGRIYQKLIPEMNDTISSLLILRSGILNYIPFGALYNSKGNNYLIEDYIISYANSATLYKEYAKQKKNKNHKILAFAPSFKNKKNQKLDFAGLGELLYNKDEVKHIAKYFDGEILLGENASLKNFKNKANNFGILHLATHAIIDDESPDYSYLAFAPQEGQSNLLYIHDLYNYDLNADLVVLSACETGIGELQKSAGMLSLARGFSYSGASSLVTTQWKIDDKSSSSLMQNLYKNLAKGETKSAALRHAKLHYLHTTDDAMLRHPYYWAGFVLTGDTSPMIESPHLTRNWPWWIIGGLGLVLVSWFCYKRLA